MKTKRNLSNVKRFDMFKKLLLASMLAQKCANCDDKDCAMTGDGDKADDDKPLQKFASEEEALAYAQRIAQMKAGDRVKYYNPNRNTLVSAVFTGAYDDRGFPIFLAYDSTDHRLMTAVCSPDSVVLD